MSKSADTKQMTEPGVYRYEQNRRSHEFFSPGPHSTERTATVKSAIFNLVSTIIGGGILSLPYAFDKCGIVLAVVFMIFSAAASNFSLYVIVSCSRRGGAATYEQVVTKALGARAGVATVAILVLLTFLTMVAYVILIKDLVGSLGEQFLYGRAMSVSEHNALTIVCVAIVSPVLFARSMDSLRFTSIFSLVSVFVLAVVITIRAINSVHNDGVANDLDAVSTDSVPVKWYPTSWKDPVYAFPIISVSFLCHFNVLPVYQELHKPTRRRLKKIVSATMFSTWVFYTMVASMGYLFAYQKPGGVKDDILNNFDGGDHLVNLGRLGLLVTILLSIPLIMQPCRRNFIRLGNYVSKFCRFIASKSWKGSKAENSALLPITNPDQLLMPSSSSSFKNTAGHAILTILIISGVIFLALTLPGVAVVWNLMGSTVGLLISYVLPCISYIRIRKSKPHNDKRKLTAWVILVISSVVCVGCTIQAISSALSL